MTYLKKLVAGFMMLSPLSFANALDPNVDYFVAGKTVAPWVFSLQFGQVQLENNTGKTVKSSLVAEPSTRDIKGDAIHLEWKDKGVKNEWGSEDKSVSTATLINGQAKIDLSSVKDQAGLMIVLKVNRAPNKLVELTMECHWDWKCRSTLPLREVLKNQPEGEWVNLTLPLAYFDQNDFDFSGITSTFMLYTSGKMDLEISDIRLVAINGKASCR